MGPVTVSAILPRYLLANSPSFSQSRDAPRGHWLGGQSAAWMRQTKDLHCIDRERCARSGSSLASRHAAINVPFLQRGFVRCRKRGQACPTDSSQGWRRYCRHVRRPLLLRAGAGVTYSTFGDPVPSRPVPAYKSISDFSTSANGP